MFCFTYVGWVCGGGDEQEGPEMRESLREERTLWVTDQIARDKFPEDLEAFYLLKNAPSEEKPPPEEDGGCLLYTSPSPRD